MKNIKYTYQSLKTTVRVCIGCINKSLKNNKINVTFHIQDKIVC